MHTLRQVIQGPINNPKSHFVVSHMLQDNTWNFSTLSFDIPKEIKTCIFNTYTTQSLEKNDTLFWKLNNNGEFSTRSAYTLYIKERKQHCAKLNFKHKRVWKAKSMNKLKFFLWTILLIKLPSASIYMLGTSPATKLLYLSKQGRRRHSYILLLSRCTTQILRYYNINMPNHDPTENIRQLCTPEKLTTININHMVPIAILTPFIFGISGKIEILESLKIKYQQTSWY